MLIIILDYPKLLLFFVILLGYCRVNHHVIMYITQYGKLDRWSVVLHVTPFMRDNVNAVFAEAEKGSLWLWIQDSDLSQNCASVRKVYCS